MLTRTEKPCNGCGETKPLTEFHSNGRGSYTSKCKPCRSKQRKEYRLRPETHDNENNYMLQRRYNITRDQWNALLESQGGVCAICQKPPIGARAFAVDHDHRCCPSKEKTCGNCIRGLLCHNCNRALGYLKDDPNLALDAATYLMKGGVSNRIN